VLPKEALVVRGRTNRTAGPDIFTPLSGGLEESPQDLRDGGNLLDDQSGSLSSTEAGCLRESTFCHRSDRDPLDDVPRNLASASFAGPEVVDIHLVAPRISKTGIFERIYEITAPAPRERLPLGEFAVTPFGLELAGIAGGQPDPEYRDFVLDVWVNARFLIHEVTSDEVAPHTALPGT
jgi:hypothetical protein